MTINDKIKQILLNKGFSPSHFADEIGVQRSSISHILSGRNRPSFDIIQKIIKRFPDLGFDWILEEDTPSTIFRQQPTAPVRRTENFSPQNHLLDSTDRSNRLYTPGAQRAEVTASVLPETDDTISNISNGGAKKIERILIFYTDGTFQDFNPSSGF